MKLDLTNKIFGRLKILSETDKNKHGHRQWLCQCECGNKYITQTQSLTCRRVLSCGCLNNKNRNSAKNDLTGRIFGKLLVINRLKGHAPKYIVKYLCKCSCGGTTNVSYSNLVSGKQKKCGNCILHKNGCLVSIKQKELFLMINKGILNYKYKKIKKRKIIIDIALIHNCKKVAIEYDEWFWHKNKLNQDSDRFSFLIKNNWRVIRVCARNNLPTFEVLMSALNSTDSYIEIVLEGWGE